MNGKVQRSSCKRVGRKLLAFEVVGTRKGEDMICAFGKPKGC